MSMKTTLVFLAGLGIGSVGTLFAVKKHYEELANEEIAAVKEYYKNERIEAFEKDYVEESVEENETAEDQTDYEEIIRKLNYNEYSHKPKEEVEILKTQKPEEPKGPYVITPEDFTNERNYEKITLTYFEGDGIFMDDMTEEEVNDAEASVGKENLSRFSEFEPDLLYVRNEKERTDYEIILREDRYSEYIVGN